jgi:hypothetical protein
MTRGALAMLVVTWSIIFFFTGKLLIRVLRTPDRDDDT